MKRPDEPPACTAALTLIEPYLDGDLPPAEERALLSHAEGCAGCREELECALDLQAGLRALPMLECPDEVVFAAAGRLRLAGRAPLLERLREWLDLGRMQLLGPSLTAAALVAAVAASLLLFRPEPAAREISAAEVDRAVEELKWTLAYLNGIGRQTGAILRDDVLEAQVVAPLRRTLTELEPTSPHAE